MTQERWKQTKSKIPLFLKTTKEEHGTKPKQPMSFLFVWVFVFNLINGSPYNFQWAIFFVALFFFSLMMFILSFLSFLFSLMLPAPNMMQSYSALFCRWRTKGNGNGNTYVSFHLSAALPGWLPGQPSPPAASCGCAHDPWSVVLTLPAPWSQGRCPHLSDSHHHKPTLFG